MAGVLATMREAVVIVDSQMRVALYNDAAAAMFKLPPNDGGRPHAHVSTCNRRGPESRASQSRSRSARSTSQPAVVEGGPSYRLTSVTRDPAINSAFKSVLEDKSPVELQVQMADRDHRSFQLNVASLGDLAVGVFFDITQLERLERVRREFFANLSHELRTPLTAMLACSETLMAGAMDDPDARTRFVEVLHKHATRMSSLISDISDLSAIESGQFELTSRDCGCDESFRR